MSSRSSPPAPPAPRASSLPGPFRPPCLCPTPASAALCPHRRLVFWVSLSSALSLLHFPAHLRVSLSSRASPSSRNRRRPGSFWLVRTSCVPACPSRRLPSTPSVCTHPTSALVDVVDPTARDAMRAPYTWETGLWRSSERPPGAFCGDDAGRRTTGIVLGGGCAPSSHCFDSRSCRADARLVRGWRFLGSALGALGALKEREGSVNERRRRRACSSRLVGGVRRGNAETDSGATASGYRARFAATTRAGWGCGHARSAHRIVGDTAWWCSSLCR
ncbi:hypothetical protein B0H17DRAFT_329957 [Mycena rosella]|uniref:Uncharacterized protein n=1 Tax=Mycena rosella TaxID=1033263 RepID=A0AAD7G304_MYCRO|nr:hypothetical protein B0H17DRAFT_329957 [Mycena rosella]